MENLREVCESMKAELRKEQAMETGRGEGLGDFICAASAFCSTLQ